MATATPSAVVEPRLRTHYLTTVRPALMSEGGSANAHAVPGLQKIVISMGVSAARDNKAALDAAAADLQILSGQRPVLRKARKSISNFKLREGVLIGAMVTLRGPRMWEFLDRLITIVIPRIKDFRGLPTRLDGRGNYSLGLPDQSVFPEIDLDKIKHMQGMDITIVTTAGTDDRGRMLLERLGLPFRREEEDKKKRNKKDKD